MPENDLGTAHGKIRVEFDNRGSTAATAALLKISKQMDAMNKRLASVQKTVEKYDKTMSSSAGSIDKAAKATKGFDTSVFKAHKSVTSFSRDMKALMQDFNKFQLQVEKLRDMARPFQAAAKGLDALNRSLTDGEGKWRAYSKAISATGIASTILNKNLLPNLLGAKQAMREMPTWTQNLYRYSTGLAKVGATGLLISKIANRNIFAKFLDTKAFAKIARDSEGAGLAIQNFVRRADHDFNSFSRAFNTAFKPISDFARSSKSFLTGAALVTSGINGLIDKFRFLGKIPKPILASLGLAISTVLPAALEVFGKALSATSNLLVGLLDGVKELSGGLLVLPGLFATIGAGVLSVVGVFKGLKDSFKDIFSSDPEKFLEAFYTMPEQLRPVALALLAFKDRWKDLQKTLQTSAFKDAGQQIKALGDTYFPIYERGAKKVILALRDAKDALAGFLQAGQTQSDVSTIFSNTSITIQRLGQSIQPALAGLRDIAVVGTAFIRDMTGGMGPLIKRFQDWANVNRQNGNLMKWMQDAREGVINLGKGLIDLTKSLWTILTIFKTDTGNNFLERFANAMARLNAAIDKSAATGFLRDLGQAIRGLGTDKMEAFMDMWHSFVPLFQALVPVIQSVAQAFSAQFVPAVQWAMTEIKIFLEVLHALGLDTIIGTILGLVGAFKLLPTVIVPIYHSLKTLTGLFLLLGNGGKIISAVETGVFAVITALDKFGPAGKRAGDKLLNVSNGFKTFASTALGVIGPVTALLAVFGAGWYVVDQGNQQMDKFNSTLKESEKEATNFRKSLNDAFMEDNGLVGGSVLNSLSQRITEFTDNLQSQIDAAPGAMAHLGDAFKDIWKGLKGDQAYINWGDVFRDSDAINEAQNAVKQTELVKAGLDKLANAGVNLADLLRSSDSAFKQQIDNLRKQGDEGNATADALQNLRKQYSDIANDMARVGKDSLDVTAGIKKIAEAGDSATESLEGLRQVLIGLGIIKTDALEAAAAYEKGLDDLSASVTEALSTGASLDDLIDKQTGTFNVGTEAGRNFMEVFKSLGEEYLNNVNAGADASTEYKKFTDQLGALSEQTGLSSDQLIQLARDAGLVPDVVSTLVQVKGKDQFTQDLTNLMLQAQQKAGSGLAIEIHPEGDANEFQAKIDEILGRDAAYANGTNVVLRPDVSEADLNKIKAKLAEAGIQMPGGPTPQVKASVPVGTLGGTGKPDEVLPNAQGAPGQINLGNANNALGGLEGSIQQQGVILGEDGKHAGDVFVDSLAEGIKSNPAAIQAAETLAQEIRDRFHHSPPKKGPLADHGDAARWAGQQFGVSYAAGVGSSEARVASAAESMGSGAASGASSGGGQGIYQAGKFLGQISQLVDFAQHAVEAFTKMAQTVLGFGKFLSDPSGKGTFFGKALGFEKDPTVGAGELAKRRGDAAQQRLNAFYGSGQRDTSQYDQSTGENRTREPGQLGDNASKQEVANYIIDKAMSRGYSREQANQFLVQAVGESGLDPGASNPAGWNGIFQFDVPTWQGAGGGDVKNAQQNIDNYFTLAQQRGLSPQTFTDPHQLGTQISIGGPLNPKNVGHEAPARAAAQQYIQGYSPGTGQQVPGNVMGIPANLNNLPHASILHDTGKVPTNQAGQNAAAILQQMFPQLKDIGGSRMGNATPGTHTEGKSIDVTIPGWDTPEGKKLGDQINDFLRANSSELGIQYTIWQNTWKDFKGSAPTTVPGHMNHIDVHFADGATASADQNGTTLKVPYGTQGIIPDNAFGPPVEPGATDSGGAPKDLVTINPDGSFSPATPHGQGGTPGPINRATGQPWTPEESAAFFNQYPMQYNQAEIKPGDQNQPGVYQGTQEQQLAELQSQTPLLQQAVQTAQDTNASQDDTIAALNVLQEEQNRQLALDTPASRQAASSIGGVISSAAGAQGLTEKQNPFDKAAGVVSNVSSIAGDIFKVVNSAIEAAGAAKDLADLGVRGVANTEDIFHAIDGIQKFIQLGADVAGAVSSVATAIGSVIPDEGTMGAGAAVSAVGQIAGLVQSALETANAVIDLGQEAYRIVGSYVGPFLQSLVGGAGGALQGNVKFLLDERTNQLLSYSADNPLDKRPNTLFGQSANPGARDQLIGNVNVYGGPGRDPRDDTRQMMFQIKTSQMAVATGQ